MKNRNLTVPILMTAMLAFIISCVANCSQKSTSPESHNPLPPPEPQPTNAGGTSASAPTVTNIPSPTAAATAPAITNPPLSATTPPATPEPAPTAPPPKSEVVEMPAATPSAPTNFYSGAFADDAKFISKISTNGNYYLRFRAGYQHINYHDNNDTYYVAAKFYAHGDDLRLRAGKNAWLVPDATAEISHQYLPKPDGGPHPGSGEGMQFRADFFWPWMHWTTQVLARSNSVCPFCRPLALGLGPVAEVGFDQLFDGSQARLARYFGARLNLNRDSFIEYTAGGTDGLPGTRQRMAAELPIYASRDGEVRYVLQGEWNHAGGGYADELSGGLFLEMPVTILGEPKKWADLIPFLGK